MAAITDVKILTVDVDPRPLTKVTIITEQRTSEIRRFFRSCGDDARLLILLQTDFRTGREKRIAVLHGAHVV